MKVKDIINILNSIAPSGYQEGFDNSGLNIGSMDQEVTGILCTLDVTVEIINEAIELGDNLIITHHPVIFDGIKTLTGKNYVEEIVILAIKNNISIYAGHTNFDNVPMGVNARICEKLELINTSILSPQKEKLCKLVTYVPDSDASKVRDALFEAGAGHIGNYDNCSFNTKGEGSFRGSENSTPYKGEKGDLHFEKEVKIEVILPDFMKNNVVNKLLKAHPYEEVAYDIYPLLNENPYIGSGMKGELKQAVKLSQLLKILKATFHADGIRYTGEQNSLVKKIAVCGGSGAFLIKKAIASKVDAFITGDIKYHQFFDAENKLSVIDIGHYESEQFTKNIFYESVMKKIPKFAVHLSEVKTSPIKYYK